MGYRERFFDSDDVLADEQEDQGSYFGRHWPGHLSLPQSYWLNGFLANIALSGLGLGFLALEQTGQSLRAISVGFVIWVLLFPAVRAWTLVGIWRSAGRHAARGGSAGWGIAARVMVVLGIASTLVQFPSLSAQAKEYGLIAIGRDPLGAQADMSVTERGDAISINGMLSAGTADRFEALIRDTPRAKTVLLQSDGGRIYEALRMAAVMRARGLDTRVDRHCASACTLLLLAGKDRSAHRFAQIGFHQPDFPGISPTERREFVASNRKDYIAAGVEQGFVERVMATPPAEMWYPTHAELVAAGALTAEEITVGTSRFDRTRLHELLTEAVDFTNRGRGTMLDDMTRLEGASLSGSELRVRHRMTRELNADPTRFKAAMRTILEDEICNSPRRSMVEMGARFGYYYDGPSGRPLLSVTIEKCPNPAT